MSKMFGYLRIKKIRIKLTKSIKYLEENLILDFGYLSSPSCLCKPIFLKKDISDYQVKITSLKKIVRPFKKILKSILQIIA